MPRRIGAPAVLVLLVAAFTSLGAAANQAPVARIAAYRPSDGLALSVTLDGSGSSDPDGSVVRYQWLFGDGTTGSGSPVTHVYAAGSSPTVTLVVWDNANASGIATLVVNLSSLAARGATSAPAPTGTSLGAQVPVGDDIGQRAPELALPNLADESIVYLSTYLGRTVLLEFWVSTCPGCQASTPQLDTWRATYADDGLVVILVILDRSPSAAVAYLDRYGYTNFVLAWESSASRPTMAAYGVAVTPTTFLIDRTGVIRYSGHPVGLTDEFIRRWL